jgi:hypothetical protein
MNNFFIRHITLTADFQPLAATRTIGTVDISCPPGNTGDAIFLGDLGQEVPWIAGEWHEFHRVDLSEIKVKGTPGDVVTVIGGTW